MSTLSGKTPPALSALLTEWPVVSAPIAEKRIGASRAARGLIREVTGQGRFRMWSIAI